MLELTNSFMAENRAGTVPVFVVLDSSMKEIAIFIETAHELVPSIDGMDEMIAKEVAGESDENARTLGARQAHRVPGGPRQRVGKCDPGILPQSGGRRYGAGLGVATGSWRHQVAA